MDACLSRCSRRALLLSWGSGLTALAYRGGPLGALWFYALSVAVWTLGEIVQEPAPMAEAAGLAPPLARGHYQGMYSLATSALAFIGPWRVEWR